MSKLLDYIAIGMRIKNYRLQKNLTQTDLADKVEVSDKYISLVERGHTKISLSRLAKVSNALDVDITILLKDVDDSSPNYMNDEIVDLISNMSPDTKKLLLKIIVDINEFGKQ